MIPCGCRRGDHAAPRAIVLTGGPGAGKTALLELVRQQFCRHVVLVPEAASILFRGGFPRDRTSPPVERAVQRAIFYVQTELEEVARAQDDAALFLCDRGAIDGAAYWPGPGSLFDAVGVAPATLLARYHAVIHLAVPPAGNGYDHANPMRIETAAEAAALDLRIAEMWRDHPRVHTIANQRDFVAKAQAALEVLRGYLPACCAAAHAVEPAR
jgi:predicted ATPase